jgi:hypothetical protein
VDWTAVSTLVTVASATIAVIALWALFKQVRQGHESITTTVLREHEKQFFYSDDFLKVRASACHFLKEHLATEFAEPQAERATSSESDWLERAVQEKMSAGVELSLDGWEIVDFFDSLAIYGDQGTIDVEVAFSKFFYFYNRYWYLLKPWISYYRRLDGEVDYYRDIEVFLDEMVSYGVKQRGLIIGSPRYSREDVRKFINAEILESQGTA